MKAWLTRALVLVLIAATAVYADAPRYTAQSVLLMWTKSVTGPTEVTTSNPLPVTFSGGSPTLDGVCFTLAAPDVGITRSAAGVLKITDCAAASYLTLGSGGLTFSAADTLAWTGRAKITSPADGQLNVTDTAGTTNILGLTTTTTTIPAASALTWLGRSKVSSSADGLLTLTNNAGTAFTRLMFGGTTSSFPALTRNAAVLEAKLADDSAYATFAAAKFTTTGTGSVSGYTLADTEIIGVTTSGGHLQFRSSANTPWVNVSPAAALPNSGTALRVQPAMSATSTTQSAMDIVSSITPASGTASFGMLEIRPTINGTSSGKVVGLGVASLTNTLTNGTIRLASFGTTTTDLYTGYTEAVGVSLNGMIVVKTSLFATLNGNQTNGTIVYCSDCAIGAACAGAGTGAFAKRLNNAWSCT